MNDKADKLIFDELTGYKYRVKYSKKYDFPELKHLRYQHEYFMLNEGLLTIHKGYVWDGASGPTWDDETNHRGSLVHDVLYQILRERDKVSRTKKFNAKALRKFADQVLIDLCLEDGMNKIRAWFWHKAIRAFGKNATLPGRDHRGKIITI